MRRSALIVVALAAVLAGLGAGSLRAASAASGCPKVPKPKSHSRERKPPNKPLDASKIWTATFVTTCGSFTVKLSVKISPHTTASFVSLARSKFYDETFFHRIIPGFVIQGGDPTGTGTGGPGYSVADTPPKKTKYVRGVVAMAKTSSEPAGTSGSQFFVVTGDASFLPPDYAVLGTVTKGMAVAAKIGKLGQRSEQGTPTQIVVIRQITISSR
jgi:cyclophilin family peptidyl-prolyl cis-trans isomerase